MTHKHLSRSLSRKATNIKQHSLSPWDEAALEAQRQIAEVEDEAKRKIAVLTESARMFEALRNSGAEFPKVGPEIAA